MCLNTRSQTPCRKGGMAAFVLCRFAVACAVVSECTAAAALVLPVYGQYETCVQLQRHYNNPFNYSEVAVQGTFIGPDGHITVDGFYYQNYTRSLVGGKEVLKKLGDPKWCVHYSPRRAGVFTINITVTDSSGTRMLVNSSFDAVASHGNQGYIGLGSNGIHFQFENTQYGNKSTYYPTGENVCWVSQKGTYDYDMYFSKLAAVRGNYARLWLTDSTWDDLAVEIAVANFSLPNTWRLDYVVRLAETNGIHLLMCTESFNYFCTNPNAPCDWNQNCYYNKKFGGFLDKPEDFFTSARAKDDYKNRLRYLVARYGYSTSVFAWEFFNEVDITDNYDSAIQAGWNAEMASYLSSIDVYSHPISTSYSNSDGDSKVQALPGLDFTMTHNYGSQDIAADTAQYPFKKLQLYKKPSYVAEFGIGNENDDKQGVSLHNGVWAPLFSLAAGTCMTWWWDSWVDPNNLYPIFKPFTSFVSRLDLATYNWSMSSTSAGPGRHDDTIRMWGMVGEGGGGREMVVGWVQDGCFRWPQQHQGEKCNPQTGVTVSLGGCTSGKKFSGEWYSTTTGQETGRTSVQCSEGKITDTVPSFTGDTAVVYTQQ